MRVKSRKPPAENFSTSDCGAPRQVVGRADDGVGDQVRQMGGDREHQVVVLRGHGLDIAPQRPPEGPQPLDRRGVGAVERREDAAAVDEQFGEAGIGAGMLGAGDRMRRHEMRRPAADAAPRRGSPRP